jgi:hypothetical protein
MNKLLKGKKNTFYNNIVIDGNNENYDKNKIFNILKVQTKSNFNNKYKLFFKSSNLKKREIIQNYFSLIKKSDIANTEEISFLSNRNYEEKHISYNKKIINKKLISCLNLQYNKKTKIKLLYKPIYSDKRKIEFVTIKSPKNNNYNSYNSYKSNNKDNNENNDCFSLFSTKNPMFQTEIVLKNQKKRKVRKI